MALLLQLCITVNSNCKELNVEETTGKYNSVNTGGYGSPNISVSDVTLTKFALSKREEDGTYSTPVEKIIDGTGLPSDINNTVIINPSDYSFGDKFSNGIYKLKYSVSGTKEGVPFAYSTEELILIACQIDCEIMAKAAMLKVANCNVSNVMLLISIRRLLCAAWNCRNLDAAQIYIDELENLLNCN